MPKISDLPSVSSLAGGETVAMLQSGILKQCPASLLVPAVGGQRLDVFANRGAASAHSGEYFFATDDPVSGLGTQYYSNGTTWTQTSTVKGELWRAAVSGPANSTTTTGVTDVTGLSGTCTLATNRSCIVRASGIVRNTTADAINMFITNQSNTVKGSQPIPASWVTANADVRWLIEYPDDFTTALVPNLKVRMQAPNTGVVQVQSGYLEVVLL